MASLFESEVRYKIEDIKEFKKKLRKLGAKLLFPYEFTDYYYQPAGRKWNLIEKNLRIREWQEPEKPTTIYFVKNEILLVNGRQFKRAEYADGKVPLFNGDVEICKSLLKDLGFEELFIIKKEKATFWELSQGFKTVAEYIKEIGWWGELEFEGKDPLKAQKEIEKALKVLEVKKELVSYKTISAIFAENKNLNNKKI